MRVPALPRPIPVDGHSGTPTMRVLDHVAAFWERLMPLTARGRPPVVAVDRRLRMRVAARTVVADDVVALDLVPLDPERRRLPGWDPGAHVDVLLPSGRMRQYSLTGDPDDRRSYRIAVRRIGVDDGGAGGSAEVHALAVGDEIALRGPRNAFPFIPAPGYLFVAGGIGITPILPMVRDAVARGDDFAFVACARTRTLLPFRAELELLALDHPDRVHLWLDDERGVPTGDDIVALAPESDGTGGAALYACGPPPMIAALRGVVPGERVASLHSERFSPPPVVGGEPFRIRLADTGEVVPVDADQTALAALREVRPDIAYSCQQGFCGACPVRLVSGEVDHRDRCLTDDGRVGLMAVCVSRGVGEITLEV